MNEYRSTFVCVVIGAAGGGLSGKVIAPLLAGPAVTATGFDFFALFVATLGAAACMALSNQLYKHFNL